MTASTVRCCWPPSTTAASCARAPTIPYVSHLLGVTSLVLEMGGSETEAIGALLHDAVEDGGGPPMLERIRVEFGDDAARIVEANSDSEIEPKPPWYQRKRAYIDAIAHKQPDELRVSLADKLHNARAILLDYRTLGDGALGPLQVRRGRLDPLVLPLALRGLRRPPRRSRPARHPRARGTRPHGRRDRPARRGGVAAQGHAS